MVNWVCFVGYRSGYALLLVLLLLSLSPRVQSEEMAPLWEFGLGVMPTSFPQYRGSSERQEYLLPFPYIRYRGDFWRVDRGGVRGMLFDSERLSIDLSLSGALPSKQSSARDGMPELQTSFEMGPSLEYIFAHNHRYGSYLKLPLRAAFITDFSSIDLMGWTFHPELSAEIDNVAGGWSLDLDIGPMFADSGYHDYYYSVAPEYQTALRPSYQAKGGYSGTSLKFGWKRRIDDLWMVGFVRYDDMRGVSFADSPLLEQDGSWMAGFGVAWIFQRSERMVPVSE